MKDKYSQEEANEILLRAIECQPLGTELTRVQLEGIAAEVGISVEALHAAEEQWAAEHLEESRERQIFARVQAKGMKARVVFLGNLCSFLFSAFIMLGISMQEDDALPIAVAILFPWAIGLIFHALHLRQSAGVGYEKAFRRWQKVYRANDRMGDELPASSHMRRLG